jgi:hypothetical protein
MKLIYILLCFVSLLPIYSNETEDSARTKLSDKFQDPLYGKNLEEAEKLLNGNIQKLNEGMQVHSKILVMKIKVLPKNALITKGKLNGEDCIANEESQEDPENNCIKLEVFDFVEGSPKKPAFGPKSKYMILGFEADPTKEKNPKNAPPRKVNLIRSSVLVDNLYGIDRKLVEVVDENPMGGDPNESIYIASQEDYAPIDFKKENPSDISRGKYRVSQMENTKINPIRNAFKREAYIKHLQAFHELFSKIKEFNDKTNTTKMQQNTNLIKESFSY